MDEQLTSGYDDLVVSISPPADARERVADRRAQRRRRKVAGVAIGAGVAVVAVVVSALALGGDDGVVAPAKDPSPTATPEGVFCADGSEPQGVDLDHPGYDSFTEMLTREAEVHGAFTVDRTNGITYYLRDDRTAHAASRWTGAPQSRWFPSSMSRCADSAQWRDVPLDVSGASERVSIGVDHCYIQVLEMFGRTWDVVAEDQFGTGGSGPGGKYMPTDWAGTGTAWRTGDVATYVDDGGRRLTFVPEGDPWALERDICD